MDKYGELINIEDLYTALVSQDDEAAYKSGENKYLAPAAEITHDTTTNVNKRFYDGKLRYVTVTEGSTSVPVVVSGVPCSLASELTGKPYNKDTGEFYDTGDSSNTPYRALSGRMELGDGGYRYFQYLKGKFSIGAEKAQTKQENITPNTVTLTYTPVVTIHKFKVEENKICGVKSVKADSFDETFNGAENWFKKVQTPPEPDNTATASEPDSTSPASAPDAEPEGNEET